MRIPIPLVLILSLAVVGGTWWYGTQGKDFLSPPSEEQLAAVRSKAIAALPRIEHPQKKFVKPVPPPPPPPPPEPPKPTYDLGDLNAPATLQQYLDQAPKGAAYLIELAGMLEKEGAFQRALLAWERVIDTCTPDATQNVRAIAAIKRLRPTLPDWNTDPKKSVTIVLQAGTGKKAVKTLTPILEKIAREIEKSSSGLLKVTAHINAGRDAKKPAASPAPVALWFSGSIKDAPTTEVMSFTVGSEETMHEEVRRTVFQILRGYLGNHPGQVMPPALLVGEPVNDAISSHISRHSWQNLGDSLNHPPEKAQ